MSRKTHSAREDHGGIRPGLVTLGTLVGEGVILIQPAP